MPHILRSFYNPFILLRLASIYSKSITSFAVILIFNPVTDLAV